MLLKSFMSDNISKRRLLLAIQRCDKALKDLYTCVRALKQRVHECFFPATYVDVLRLKKKTLLSYRDFV